MAILNSADIAAAGGALAATAVGRHASFNFMQELRAGVRNLNGLIVGDSTTTRSGGGASATGGWSYQFVVLLGQAFPEWTIVMRSGFSASAGTFGTTETIQTGTGSRTLTVYNVGVSGTVPTYALGAPNAGGGYYPSAIGAASFDLVLWSFGFNMNTTDPSSPSILRGLNSVVAQQVASLSQIMSWHVRAGLVVIEQWPFYGNQNGTINSRTGREVARHMGGSLLSTEYELISRGKPASLYNSSTAGEVHLSPDGYAIVANKLLAEMLAARSMTPTLPLTSLQTLETPLLNAKFDTYSAGVAANWSATNLTLGEDTTDYLTGSRSLTATIGTNTAAYIEQSYSGSALRRLSRRMVTVSADLQLPSSSPANRMGAVSVSYNGVEQLGQESYSSVSNVIDISGRWVRKAVQMQLPEILDLSLPLTVRVYPLVGAGIPTGAGLVTKIDNVHLDIGERIYANG